MCRVVDGRVMQGRVTMFSFGLQFINRIDNTSSICQGGRSSNLAPSMNEKSFVNCASDQLPYPLQPLHFQGSVANFLLDEFCAAPGLSWHRYSVYLLPSPPPIWSITLLDYLREMIGGMTCMLTGNCATTGIVRHLHCNGNQKMAF